MANAFPVAPEAASRRQRARRRPARGVERFRELLESGRASTNSYVVLIGLETFSSSKIIESIKHGLPFSAFDRFCESTSLPSQDALVLVNISPRTLSRRKRERRF